MYSHLICTEHSIVSLFELWLFPFQAATNWQIFSQAPPPQSGELRTQKSKSHLVRTQSLNVLPLKPGVGQYIAIHATLPARDFFLAFFYHSGPFTYIFSKPLPIFPVLAVSNTWVLCRPAKENRSPCGGMFPC